MQWNRAVPEPEASIKLHEAYHWPVYKLCSAAGINRAGYYKWLSRTASSKRLEDERLAHLIVEIYQNQRCTICIILMSMFSFVMRLLHTSIFTIVNDIRKDLAV